MISVRSHPFSQYLQHKFIAFPGSALRQDLNRSDTEIDYDLSPTLAEIDNAIKNLQFVYILLFLN